MNSSTDSEIAAERQRDEEERRRRREMRFRHYAAAGSWAAAGGIAALVILSAFAMAGATASEVSADVTGLLRVFAAILILGGVNLRLRSAASLRAEQRWAEQQRVHRLLHAGMEELHAKFDSLVGLVAQSVHGSPVAEAMLAKLGELSERQTEQDETLAKVAERVDVAYMTGFTDGVGGAKE